MTHDFIVNDENIVNEYGYRVMTDGISLKQYKRNPVVLFIHDRGFTKPNGANGSEVIGRAIKLWKKDGQLIATVEFDVDDKFAKKIAGKVDRGYIKMASIYADVKETSIEPEDVLPGQVFETVTKSKLTEISIVDIGGNDNALKLSMDGKRIKLKRLNTKTQKKQDMSLETIALALGVSTETKAPVLASNIQKLKLAKEEAENKVNELEKSIKKSQEAEAKKLTDKAVELSLIPEGLKASTLKSFDNDFEGQKAVLSKLIEEKQGDEDLDGKSEKVREVVLGGKGSSKKGNVELSFDQLQKENPEELRRIRDEEPEKYAKLCKGYADGVRFNPTKQ